MDTAKVIAVPETGGFAAIYHSWRDDSGVFDVHLATSTDLLTWTWQVRLATEASQPTIKAASDGGYVVSWDVTPPVGDGAPVFTYYPTWRDLLAAAPTKRFDVPLTLSPCCEGTVNFYRASSTFLDVGFHRLPAPLIADRQGHGHTDWKTWEAAPETDIDGALMGLGVVGHIGDRDAIRFRSLDLTLIEGQVVLDDNSSWRIFLYDPAMKTAEKVDIRTGVEGVGVANPTVEVVRLDGRLVIVVGLFLHGDGPNTGQLIYYRTVDA